MIKSPFKFLDSYSLEDRNTFFGRDQEITDLFRKVLEGKILLVYGISGTGKSSLVNCGLASRFDQSDWLPINVRRGSNIIDSLNEAVNRHAITSLKKTESFVDKIQSLYLDHFKPVFLIFDQFEELFIFGSPEEKKEFLELIKAVVRSRLNCNVIFVIREEFLAGMTEFDYDLPEIFFNRYRVEKMKKNNAISAIEGPCKVNGIEIEPGFSEELINKLSPSGTDVELTFLQIYLDRIFKIASVGRTESDGLIFSNELLTKAGSVSDLLGQFLDEQIRQLDDPDTGMSILKSFVSVQGTKRQMNESEIMNSIGSFGIEIKEPDLLKYLTKFVDLRILRERDEAGYFELRHDSLAYKIYEKITLVEKEILEIRQFIENAYVNFEKRKIFLGTDDLNYISSYADKLFVNKKLSDFIENSKKNLTAKKRAFNRILNYSAIGFSIIIISVFLYYFKSNISAKSRELTIESFLQKEFSPSLSFRTAMNAYSKDTTSTIAIKAMFDSFYELLENSPYYDSLNNGIDPLKSIFDFSPCNSNILYARFSEDGKYIYGYLEDNSIDIWDITGKLVFSERLNIGPIIALNFAPDNEYIAAVYIDSTAVIWDMHGKIIFNTKVIYNPVNPLDVINFSPIKNLITYLPGNNKIIIHNLNDSSQYVLEGHTGNVNGSIFSPDGKFVASASNDSTVLIWLLNDSSGILKMVSKITGFNGPVWSVDFAQNSKYVLCVSDSVRYPITLKRITGEDLGTMQYFLDPIRDSSWVKEYPAATYYGKFYSAHFTANDGAIRISSFNDTITSVKNHKHKRENKSGGFDFHRIMYSRKSMYSLTPQNKFLKGYDIDQGGKVIDKENKYNYYYSGVDVSTKYIANNISGNDFSILYYYDRLPIRKFIGTQPYFSPDGNYLLCIDGKNLKLYPAMERELIRLVSEKLVFRELDKIEGEWKHLFKDR